MRQALPAPPRGWSLVGGRPALPGLRPSLVLWGGAGEALSGLPGHQVATTTSPDPGGQAGRWWPGLWWEGWPTAKPPGSPAQHPVPSAQAGGGGHRPRQGRETPGSWPLLLSRPKDKIEAPEARGDALVCRSSLRLGELAWGL